MCTCICAFCFGPPGAILSPGPPSSHSGAISSQHTHYGKTSRSQELDQLRRLPSFRPFVEGQASAHEKRALLTDDAFLRTQVLDKLLPALRQDEELFYFCARLLHVLLQST